MLIAAPATPPPTPPTVVAPGHVIDWNLHRDGSKRTYVSGPYRITLDGAHSPEGDGGGMLARITVSDAGETRDHPESFQWLHLSGAVGFETNAYARLAVARLDPASPLYSVVVTSFTGGAHCCDDVQIATPSPTALTAPTSLPGWTVLHPGAFDSVTLGVGADPRLPADGAGVFALVIPDSAFDYAYDSYGGSFAPIHVFGLRSGKLVDRSGDAAFRPLLESDARRAEGPCRAGGSGVCPGYLADMARLGRWADGWRVLQAGVREKPQWAFPDRLCDGALTAGKCRPGQRETAVPTYAASVRLFLRQRGYPVPAG